MGLRMTIADIRLQRSSGSVRRALLVGLGIGLFVLGLQCVAATETDPGSRGRIVAWEAVDEAAQPFTLEDLNARILTSRELAGKVVLLDFWATWCVPCVRELPELAQYAQRIRGREDVIFLSLNVTDERSSLRTFVREHGITYPVFSGDELLDPFGVFAFPTKLILDLRGDGPGTVRFRHFGFTSLDAIESQVEAILTERAGH